MNLPIRKLRFTDFENRVEELRRPSDEGKVDRLSWHETQDSVWIYFDIYYTQVSKTSIEESQDFDSVDDFKIKFLGSALELVQPPPELYRIEFLLEHFHYSHMHQGFIAPVEDQIGLNPQKEQIILTAPPEREIIEQELDEEVEDESEG